MGDGMHLLDVTLPDVGRAAFVMRSELAEPPMLRRGDGVVLRDQHGDYFSGSVLDVHAAAGDVGYLLRIGVRLPAEYAMLRAGRRLPAGRPRRSASPRIPSQSSG